MLRLTYVFRHLWTIPGNLSNFRQVAESSWLLVSDQRNRKRGPRSQMARLRRSLPKIRRTLPGVVAGEVATVAPALIQLHPPHFEHQINSADSESENSKNALHDQLSQPAFFNNSSKPSVSDKRLVRKSYITNTN